MTIFLFSGVSLVSNLIKLINFADRVAVDEAPRSRIVIAVRQAQQARLAVRVVAVLAAVARWVLHTWRRAARADVHLVAG